MIGEIMNITLKNLIKATSLILCLLFIFSIIINSLYYFDIINNNVVKYFKMMLSILTYFIGGSFIGKKSDNKGYINGLRLSGIIVIISIITGVLCQNISTLRIVYYLITTICITFGAMIGISKKTS